MYMYVLPGDADPNGPFRDVHQIILKWACMLQGQRYSICVLLVSLSPKFQDILLYNQLFFELK